MRGSSLQRIKNVIHSKFLSKKAYTLLSSGFQSTD